jgi:hypothetical protein
MAQGSLRGLGEPALAPCHLAKQNAPDTTTTCLNNRAQESDYAAIPPKSVTRHNAERQIRIRTHFAATPCGSVAKIGREDGEHATLAPLVPFGSVFRLFWV